MEEQNERLFSLWRERNSLPRISRASAALLLILAVGAALLSAAVMAWIPLILGGAALALLLTVDRSPLWLIAAFCAPALALLLRQAIAPEESLWFWLLSALSFVPVGMVLAACIFGRKSLTSTAASLTVVFVLLVGAGIAIQLHAAYGSVAGGLRSLIEEVREQLHAALAMVQVPSEDGVRSLTASEIADFMEVMETAIMLTPAMGILLCELLAYCTAKLFRFGSIQFSAGFLFRGSSWPITASLPANLMILVTFLLMMLLPESSIAGYAVMNLFFIFLPVTAIGGFHTIFGKEARARRSPGSHTALIVCCIVSAFLSPPMPVLLFSLWGATHSIFSAIRGFLQKRFSDDEDDDGDDRNDTGDD